jgi:hypothetical protein
MKFTLFLALLLVADTDARGGRRGKRKCGGATQTVAPAPVAPATKKVAVEVILPPGVAIDKSNKPDGLMWLTIRRSDGTTKIIFAQEVNRTTGDHVPYTPEQIRFMDYVKSLAIPQVEVPPAPRVELDVPAKD